MTPQTKKLVFGIGAAVVVLIAAGQLARHNGLGTDKAALANASEDEEARSGRTGAFNLNASAEGSASSGGNAKGARGKGAGNGSDNPVTTKVSAMDGTTSEGAFVETEAETRERERYEQAQKEAFKYRKLDPNKIKPTELAPAFADATKKYNLPEHLLAAIAYVETGGTHRDGQHSMEAGYGVMNLRESNLADTVAEGASAIGKTKDDVLYDQKLNIEAAAALLSRYYEDALASGLPESEALYMAVSMYSGRPNPELAAALADEVAGWMLKGFQADLNDGGGSFNVPANPNPPFLPKNWKLVGLDPPAGITNSNPQAVGTPSSSRPQIP